MPQSIHTFRLDNGLTVVVETMPHVRSVAWTLLVAAGSANDPEGQNGAAQLLNDMVYRGAGERDARALSNALDELGVQRGGSAGVEYTTFSGALLAEDFAAALALYADIVRRPHLPAAELDAARALTLQSLQSLNDNPAQRLFNEFGKIYFPGAFGRSALGELEDVQRIDAAALNADHAARYRPGGSVLAVAGGVEPERIRATVEQLFGDWQGAPPSWPQPQARTEPLYHHLQQETAQTQIAVAYKSLPFDDPHYYHERLAIHVLSGSMSSRLFTEVRVKRGLVYTVYASPRLYRGLGIVLGYAGTQPERAQETVDVMLGELRRMREGVADDELERSRTGFLSALVMQGESTTARAAALASNVFLIDQPRSLDDTRSAVEAVTLDSLNGYLAQHAPEQFTVITLGPAPITL